MREDALPFDRFVELLADAAMLDPERIQPGARLAGDLGLQPDDVERAVGLIELEMDLDLEGADARDVLTVAALHRALTAPAVPPHEAALRGWLPHDPCADAGTLPAVIAARAAATPDRVAVDFGGEALTFAALAAAVERDARALRAQGVGPGDRVVLVMPNGLSFFSAFYGAQRLGAVAVPVFHVPQPDRIARIALHCGARLILTPRPLARPIHRRLAAALGEGGPRILDSAALAAGPSAEGPLPDASPDDLAMLQYTSGTTGDAKGVMLTHRALVANLRQAIPKARFTTADVFVSWLPVYHDMGLITMTMCPLYLGAKLALLPARLDADGWLSAIQAHRGTVTAAPDFAFRYVLRVGGDLSRYDVRSLRMALVAAEPVRARTIERFEAATGLSSVLRPGYGLAEASVAVTFYPLDVPSIQTDEDGVVAVGTPVAGTELSIRDLKGRPLPRGARGEICLRGPSQTLGYWRNPDATAALFTDDGSVRTGDLGYLADDGMLTIVDRLKSIIIISGRNVSPKEIEEIADAVEGVGASMAVGLDEGGDVGEQLHLVVESSVKGLSPADTRKLSRAARRAVQEHMGVPVRRVYVTPRGTIPRTYNGKLQYLVMRSRLAETGSPLS